jgi:hypothetical protein
MASGKLAGVAAELNMDMVAPNKAFASEIRTMLAALLVGSCLLAADLASAQVANPQYPFCIQGDDCPGWSNCSFDSFRECQATASDRAVRPPISHALLKGGPQIIELSFFRCFGKALKVRFPA